MEQYVNTDFTRLSNAEINIKLMSLKNQFEVDKQKVMETLNEMMYLDKEYTNGKNELKNRGMKDNG